MRALIAIVAAWGCLGVVMAMILATNSASALS